MVKIFIKFFFIFFLFFPIKNFGQTILIDPGHGGIEEGTVYFEKNKSIKEKDITLEISKKIYEGFSKKNYTVFLTRSVDRTVTLNERAELAEKVKADFFISIHVNSNPEVKASGFETYYLNNHNDVAVKKMEKIENFQSLKNDKEIESILIDLVVDQTVKIAKPMAISIHEEIAKSVSKKYKMPNRGLRPSLFYVLALSKRPAVLLEVGFLSTKKDRKNLLNKKFQKVYADAVVNGLDKFLKKIK